MADHAENKTHSLIVSQSGGAMSDTKPSGTPPRRTKHTGHRCRDTHQGDAGEGRAIPDADAKELSPAPENDADRARIPPIPSGDTPDPHESPQGAHGATVPPKPSDSPHHAKEGGQPRSEVQHHDAPEISEAGQNVGDTQADRARLAETHDEPPQGAHGAISKPKPSLRARHAKEGGHRAIEVHHHDAPEISEAGQNVGDTQADRARLAETHDESPQGAHGATICAKPSQSPHHAKDGGHATGDTQGSAAPEIGEAGHQQTDNHAADARFADPLIVQISEQWRLRQDMVRAMSKLTLQAKAILRRLCLGDKDEADKLYRSLSNDKDHPLKATAKLVVAPLLMAREPLEETRKALEKQLEKMAKGLPIAHMVEDIKGFGYGGLAGIVGECGDLSEYKSVAAVWKFCGLAVINGERQRKKTGDAAIEQGYNPLLRSLIWTLADSLFKSQSRGVNDGAEVGPYRVAYDKYKAFELEKTAEYRDKETGKTETRPLTPRHAHNRAMRKMSKDLLRDLVVAWRADRASGCKEPIMGSPDPQILMAAE